MESSLYGVPMLWSLYAMESSCYEVPRLHSLESYSLKLSLFGVFTLRSFSLSRVFTPLESPLL